LSFQQKSELFFQNLALFTPSQYNTCVPASPSLTNLLSNVGKAPEQINKSGLGESIAVNVQRVSS